MAGYLVMMRHGESQWNKQNLFTGWVDVPLSIKGIDEAKEAGKRISHIPFDAIFISSLIRASLTLFIAMAEHALGKVPVLMHPGEGKLQQWAHIFNEETLQKIIPVYSAWQLNERMYGKLQGLNKDETRAKFGKEQVKLWRRSFDTAPPDGESLSDTAKRTLPYFKEKIVPYLTQDKNILVSAHGNSMRAIVMHLEDLSREEVISLEISTGEPLCYKYKQGSWTRVDVDSIQRTYQQRS